MSKAKKLIIRAKAQKFSRAYLAARGVTPDDKGLYTLGDKKYRLIGGELIEQGWVL